MMRAIASILVLGAVIACSGGTSKEDTAAVTVAATPAAKTDSVADTASVTLPSTVGTTGSSKSGASGGVQKGTAKNPSTAGTTKEPVVIPPIGQTKTTVATVLGSASMVGQKVSVTGRCIGYSKPVARGSAPLSRSDWQLEDGGAAVWVNGDFPPGCSGTTEGASPVTIVAVVRQDTIRSLGSTTPQTRQYLVRSPD